MVVYIRLPSARETRSYNVNGWTALFTAFCIIAMVATFRSGNPLLGVVSLVAACYPGVGLLYMIPHVPMWVTTMLSEAGQGAFWPLLVAGIAAIPLIRIKSPGLRKGWVIAVAVIGLVFSIAFMFFGGPELPEQPAPGLAWMAPVFQYSGAIVSVVAWGLLGWKAIKK